uniref:Uncharacterized protein n=1 Tax=Aegilops tauschii subsp. strangulata TaxID=200361 RepID=A0A452Z2H1_AEGTS
LLERAGDGGPAAGDGGGGRWLPGDPERAEQCGGGEEGLHGRGRGAGGFGGCAGLRSRRSCSAASILFVRAASLESDRDWVAGIPEPDKAGASVDARTCLSLSRCDGVRSLRSYGFSLLFVSTD